MKSMFDTRKLTKEQLEVLNEEFVSDSNKKWNTVIKLASMVYTTCYRIVYIPLVSLSLSWLAP